MAGDPLQNEGINSSVRACSLPAMVAQSNELLANRAGD